MKNKIFIIPLFSLAIFSSVNARDIDPLQICKEKMNAITRLYEARNVPYYYDKDRHFSEALKEINMRLYRIKENQENINKEMDRKTRIKGINEGLRILGQCERASKKFHDQLKREVEKQGQTFKELGLTRYADIAKKIGAYPKIEY